MEGVLLTSKRNISKTKRFRIYERDNYNCQICFKSLKYYGFEVRKKYMQEGKMKELIKDEATLDHIIPLVAGGTNADDNLRVLCRSCNSSKGGR